MSSLHQRQCNIRRPERGRESRSAAFVGVEAVMAKFVRKPVDLDEFQYDNHDVLFHCDLKVSRQILHTAANPGRKFLTKLQQLENKKQQLESENYDLQSALTQAMRNPIGLSSNEECSNSNTFEYNIQSEIETLKKRVALLENITGGSK
ncbi:hypothetical protein LINPERHAP2_LOCUS28654 [Linum perenne]